MTSQQESRNPTAHASRGSVERLRVKTRKDHSLAVAGTAFSLFALIRDNMRREALSALFLALSALHLLVFVPSALAVSPTEVKNGGSPQWGLRVDEVDTGDVSLDPSFESALLKDLLRELAKTKRFKEVLLSGDRNAREVPDLLILKMTVQEYAPGGETRRATLADAGALGVVAELFLRFCGRTTVSGETKLNVRVQLYTREGHLVLDNVVEGDVGFTGDNSRAARNLAHNVAVTLKRSTLPDTAIAASEPAHADARVTSCEVSVRVGNTALPLSKAGRAVRFESVLLALSKTTRHELIATCTDNLCDVIDTSLSLHPVSDQTLLVRVRSIRHWRVANLQT